MTYYNILFSFIGALTLIKAHLVAKNYAPYLASYVINEKMWNPNSDRIKLTFIITLFTVPIIFFKLLIKYNSDNFIFNYTYLSLIILIMIFCIWMMKKVIATEFDLKINQTKTLQTHFKNEVYDNDSKNINFHRNTIASEKSIDIFINLIKGINLYNPKIKNFKTDDFIDTINGKDSNLTELRAIQYVIILYIIEYLNENITSQNYSELMKSFNPHFKIKSKGKEQELTSSNWNNFISDFKISYKNSQFYIKISNEFKKSIEK